jgi:peptidoglycan/LPS O-acetylase OafA/YrhL
MAHLWSIGIEEQFYAFWPIVVKNVKRLLRFLVLISGVVIFLRVAAKFADIYFDQHFLLSFLSCTRFDCMAIGGIASVLFHSSNEKFLRVAKSRIVELCFWSFVLLAVFNRFTFFSILTDTVVSILAALYIVYQIASDRVVISLEKPLFKHLGIVSFGLYVYHPIIISLLAFGYSFLGLRITLHPAALILIIVGATYFVSLLSYKFLEVPFLRFKNKFVVVESTNK